MQNELNVIEEIAQSIVSVVLSNPTTKAEYQKIRIYANNTKQNDFFCEQFTKTQVFHKNISIKELQKLLASHCGSVYKNSAISTRTETITILANKKGKISVIRKKSANENTAKNPKTKEKKYLLQEGIPVPFLIHLGVMTENGKIIASKYDKFRQINRFLEFIDDIMPKDFDGTKSYRVLDFGCGKSYLTFALYHYLTKIRKIKADITGLDIKEDVITNCSELAKRWNYDGLKFETGRIENYEKDTQKELDFVVTLHACDTATDYALDYAIKNNAKAILSVPCCQHEVNSALSKHAPNPAFDALLKYGLIKERFSTLVTDVMRAEILESRGYNVQLLEFIDIEHTPKNVLIRAVKKSQSKELSKEYTALCNALDVKIMLDNLLT